MINEFLFKLVNDAKADFGDIPMPTAPVTPYTGARRAVQDAVLFAANSRDRVRAAISLTLMLRHSVLANEEVRYDARRTYTDDELFSELLGGTDDVQAPAGISATYAAGAASPSEEHWVATVYPGNKLSVQSSTGTEVVDAVFSATQSVAVYLRGGDITVHVIGIPAVGARITISRLVTYRYSLAAARTRLDLIGESVLLSTIPVPLHALLRNGFTMKNSTRLLAAAIGVAYGQ